MSTNKHHKARRPSDMDLGMDPGIGSSKGTFKEGDELDEGANTFEGDVANDVTARRHRQGPETAASRGAAFAGRSEAHGGQEHPRPADQHHRGS